MPGLTWILWQYLGPLSQGQPLRALPLLGVLPVQPDLGQDAQVHRHLVAASVKVFFQPMYLESATDEELRRGVPDVEVAGLEEVPAGPHGHHGEGHAVGGAVLEVPVELGHAQHGLGEDGQEANLDCISWKSTFRYMKVHVARLYLVNLYLGIKVPTVSTKGENSTRKNMRTEPRRAISMMNST